MLKKIMALGAVSLLVSSVAFAATPSENQYGNHCALGLTMGKQVKTDCSINWKDPTTNKSYCFGNEEAKAEWAKNTSTNIAKADAEYTKISSLNAAAKTIDSAVSATKQAMGSTTTGASH